MEGSFLTFLISVEPFMERLNFSFPKASRAQPNNLFSLRVNKASEKFQLKKD